MTKDLADNSKGTKPNYARKEFPQEIHEQLLPLLENAFKKASVPKIGINDFIHANLDFFRDYWEKRKVNFPEDYCNAETIEQT